LAALVQEGQAENKLKDDLETMFAAKLLKDPRDVKERAALEAFIARELYGLSLDDWKHLTGTFTFGSGETKADLDEIIRLSFMLWAKAG
jgi:hypothetical protein